MFSVIIPVYNGEKFIERAIGCVLSQSFVDWELIVVNDGSTDQTAEILKAYTENEKIKIISQENGGVSRARNTGMQNATRDYFAFLDCDDIWNPNHLAHLAHMISKYPDCGTYATLGQVKCPDGSLLAHTDFFEGRGDSEGFLYISDFFAEYDRDKRAKTHNTTCACVSRAAAEAAGGFREGCKIGEDLAFFLLAAVYYPVLLSPHITTLYEKSNSTATKDLSFDPDWFFFEAVEDVYKDAAVSAETKASIRRVMGWFTMRRARHYAIDGQKKKAWRAFFGIEKNPALFKDKCFTFVLLCMPTQLVRKIFAARWRTQG